MRLYVRSVFPLFALLTSAAAQANLDSISVPVGSMDAVCRAQDAWSVSGDPIPTTTGIGYLVNPAAPTLFDYTIHDHVYTSPNVPDPTRAVITYHFTEANLVTDVDWVQHQNGITRIEGFAGNSLGSLTSVGNVFCNQGDLLGLAQFTEGEHSLFTFTSPTPGTYFQIVITKTSLVNGYAGYRTYLNATPVPEPGSLAALGLGMTALLRRRLKR